MKEESQISTNLVSVIIPTYKRSERLPNAINSILNQTYPTIEIIIVDDNGLNEYTTATESQLKSYIDNNQIKYIKHPKNQGGCIARNTGVQNANGNYITFLDDDDFYEPTKVQEQVKFLKNNTQLDACMCAMFRVDENNNEIKSKENFPRGINLKEAILDGNIFTSMLMIKKNIFDELDGFSNIPRFQDRYFLFKFLNNNFKIGIIESQLLTLVEHTSERISSAKPDKIIDALDILHVFENKNKNLFLKKEWKYIKNRYYYMKAYNQIPGGFTYRIQALKNIINSLPYYTGDFNFFKLFIKALIP